MQEVASGRPNCSHHVIGVNTEEFGVAVPKILGWTGRGGVVGSPVNYYHIL